ncbi:hypothetical protein ACFP3Q_05785 [Nocardioides sp. GCM10027113]|uniref:hypothetical protein n=1 Tax=unclassified Nocardioides TaxID=2615069 RepID=UPI003607C9F7
MPATRPLPRTGSVFLDPRGDGRALRVSWHHDDGGVGAEGDRADQGAGLVVLSLWRDNVCSGSFRLAAEDVAELIAVLAAGLGASCHQLPAQTG